MADVLCARVPTLRRWQQRITEPSSAPKPIGRPKVVPAEAVEQIRQCYKDHYKQWGPCTLAIWAVRKNIGNWCATTIANVIADLHEEPEKKAEPIRFEITATGVMWSEDGTGFKEDGQKKELLIVQDEHARFKLNHRLVDGPACEKDVLIYLKEAFSRYGAPLVLKHDGDSIFHGKQMQALLEEHQVIDLTGPAYYPPYNGKLERANRDVKGYVRARRRHGPPGLLLDHVDAAMTDLNDERPRPMLDGRTAREVFENHSIKLPDRQRFRKEVDQTETRLLAGARSRSEERSARRRAIEHVLLRYSLMKESVDVSRN